MPLRPAGGPTATRDDGKVSQEIKCRQYFTALGVCVWTGLWRVWTSGRRRWNSVQGRVQADGGDGVEGVLLPLVQLDVHRAGPRTPSTVTSLAARVFMVE